MSNEIRNKKRLNSAKIHTKQGVLQDITPEEPHKYGYDIFTDNRDM